MTDAKHTPGPFHVIEVVVPPRTKIGTNYVEFNITRPDGGLVADGGQDEYGRPRGCTNSQFDAQLMAAAPDLLAACEAALAHIIHERWCDEYTIVGEEGTCTCGASKADELMTAAIAKAKGGK